jgi:cholesterol oxidase
MYICDGSVVSANLGVNPSLTITSMTERAMSFIPPASATTFDDAGQPAVVSVR